MVMCVVALNEFVVEAAVLSTAGQELGVVPRDWIMFSRSLPSQRSFGVDDVDNDALEVQPTQVDIDYFVEYREVDRVYYLGNRTDFCLIQSTRNRKLRRKRECVEVTNSYDQ